MEDQQLENEFEEFFRTLADLLIVCDKKSEWPSPSDIEYCLDRLNLSVQALEYIEFHLLDRYAFDLVVDIQDLLYFFRIIKKNWNEISIELCMPSELASVEDAVHQHVHGPGRPVFVLDMKKVQYMFSLGFKMSDIAKCLLIHRTTLWRKFQESGIKAVKYSSLGDDDLMTEIRRVYHNHIHCGVSMMLGHLRCSAQTC